MARCKITVTPVDLFPASPKVRFRVSVDGQRVVSENGGLFKTRKAAQRAAVAVCAQRKKWRR